MNDYPTNFIEKSIKLCEKSIMVEKEWDLIATPTKNDYLSNQVIKYHE